MRALSLLSVTIALAACAGAPKPEPEIASSASEGGYAIGYTSTLTTALTEFNARENTARKAMASWNAYPSALKDPSWPHVVEIVDAADRDGRGYAYVERIRQIDGAHAFYESEKDEIGRRVGGAVQFLVKKKSCDVELGGTVQGTMNEAVERQLQKELREASEAQLLVDRYRSVLGKDNAAELEKQSDGIAFASYLVHVEIVEWKVRIERLLAESERIKRTAEGFVAAEKSFQAEHGETAADKKASDGRIEQMNKSTATLDAAVEQAKALAPKLDERTKTMRKEYDDAFATLKARLDDKVKASK